MKRFISIVIALASLGAGACTTTRPVESSAAVIQKELAVLIYPGQRVQVLTPDGLWHKLTVEGVAAAELVATAQRPDGGQALVRIPVRDVKGLKRTEYAPGRTDALLVLLVDLPLLLFCD